MRAIGVSSIALATMVLTATDVRSANNNWCAIYTKPENENCTFATFEQCQAQVWGLGGWCRPNPFPNTAFATVGPGASHCAKLPRQLMEATASSQRLDRAPRELDRSLPTEQLQQDEHPLMGTQGAKQTNLIAQRTADHLHPHAGREPARSRQSTNPLRRPRLQSSRNSAHC